MTAAGSSASGLSGVDRHEHWNRSPGSPRSRSAVVELRRNLGNPAGAARRRSTRLHQGHRAPAPRVSRAPGRGSAHGARSSARPGRKPEPDRVTAYRNERSRIEQLVGEINGDFAHVGTPAVHYIYQPLEPVEVAALYRAADVMLVTPLHDGMNLVAKEFVASRVADPGVLVLSEFAGAAHELTEALLVNPHDIEGVKRAILNALSLPEGEVTRRMRILRSTVKAHTVYDWARRFLDDLVPVE